MESQNTTVPRGRVSIALSLDLASVGAAERPMAKLVILSSSASHDGLCTIQRRGGDWRSTESPRLDAFSPGRESHWRALWRCDLVRLSALDAWDGGSFMELRLCID